MLRFLHTSLGKVVSGVAILGLAAGGALAGTALTAGGATSPAVDHFLCYVATSTRTAAGPNFKVPASVRLINQFSPKGFAPKVGAVDLHCNPVQKTVPTHVTKITNPNAHLLCWKISAATPAKTVNVGNQFGKALLQIGAPSQMCLPSWKSLKTPPKNAAVAPPGLSHFTCYSVTYVPGTAPFKPPTSVQLKDQFSARSVSVKVGAPVLLCLPTSKVANGVGYKMQNPQAHLLCFGVSATPAKSPVYDQNQFGRARVSIGKTSLLCLPSTKVVVPPTTTTTATTTSTTTTTTTQPCTVTC